jgi:hypothetical protein
LHLLLILPEKPNFALWLVSELPLYRHTGGFKSRTGKLNTQFIPGQFAGQWRAAIRQLIGQITKAGKTSNPIY